MLWVVAPVLYLVYCLLDPTPRRGGLASSYFQKLKLWRRILDALFPNSQIVAPHVIPATPHMFAAFPHGAATCSHFMTMTDAYSFLSKVHPFPRRDLAASILFYVPFLRELLLLLGNVDASAKTAEYNLAKGRSLLIFVGGEREQLLASPGVQQVYLNSRKGFVKLALKYQTPLVPMYCFGEVDTYVLLKPPGWLAKLRHWVCVPLQIVIPLALHLKPRPVSLRLCVGEPLPCPVRVAEEITPAVIDAYHARFVEALRELYNKHRGPLDSDLIVT